MSGLAAILEVSDLGGDVWQARTPPGSGRGDIFGGQVAAQALRAASMTVDPRHLASSVHCAFLRRGRPDLPLDLHVERIRGGRTYTTRRVDVGQDGKVVFTLLASFHLPEPGPEVELAMPSGVPGPESVPARTGTADWSPPFEMRIVETEPPHIRWWGRITEPFPPDPALHLCALLYASDMQAGGAAMAAIGIEPGGPPQRSAPGAPVGGQQGGNFGSLDHAVWFHRVPAVDEWFFCEVKPLTVRDSRGLVLGTMFSRDGHHVATFTQEMFLKLAEDGPGTP